MSYKSIVVSTVSKKRDSETPEFSFLRCLHRDLRAFGRDDVSMVVLGDQAFLSWSTLYNRPAAASLRTAVARSRLIENQELLRDYEAKHSGIFANSYTVDSDAIDPEIVECSEDTDQLEHFNYYCYHQSMAAKVKRGRFAQFCVYDRSINGRPLMAIIGLSSAVYFNGARDAHIGWGPIRSKIDGEWVNDADEKEKRDLGLLHLSHVTISTPVPPYDRLKIGKLLSAICFNPAVIGCLEEKYEKPIVGLSTTGGWGVNAAPYQRIKLGSKKEERGGKVVVERRDLFEAVSPKYPSLNTTFEYFSDETLDAALELHKVRSPEPSDTVSQWRSNSSAREMLLKWSLKLLQIPRKAVYVNEVGHFFGTVTDDAKTFLADVRAASPPSSRTIPTEEALAYWREKSERMVLRNVQASRLSDEI